MKTTHNVSFFDRSKSPVIATSSVIPPFDGQNLYNIKPASETISFTSSASTGVVWNGSIATIAHHLNCMPNVLVMNAENELVFPTVTIPDASHVNLDFNGFTITGTYKCVIVYGAPFNGSATIIDAGMKNGSFDILSEMPSPSSDSTRNVLYIGATTSSYTKYHFYSLVKNGLNYEYIDKGEFETGLGVHEANAVIHVTSSEKSYWDSKSEFSGNYNELTSKPSIPVVNNPTITFTQGGVTKGAITLNQASNQTISFDAGGGGGSSPEVTSHISNADIHVTSALKDMWTGKQDAITVSNKLDNSLVNPLTPYTALSGTSVTIEPGKEYIWSLTDSSTLNISGCQSGYTGQARIEITNTTHTLNAGEGLVLKDSIQSNAVNYYTVKFKDDTAKAYLYDIDSL